MSSTATAGLAFVKKRIRESAKQNNGKPLANPYWWAAFQCIGAGWPAE